MLSHGARDRRRLRAGKNKFVFLSLVWQIMRYETSVDLSLGSFLANVGLPLK